MLNGCIADTASSSGDPPAIDSSARSADSRLALKAASLPSAGSPADSIRYLTIDSFPDLPRAVRKELAERGCIVPQASFPRTPHSVVKGEFAARGQTDWAALCTRGDTADIVVVWGGPITCPTPLAPAALQHQMQRIAANETGYSRALFAASVQYIVEHDREHTAPRPAAIDHSGINDAFVGKASSIHYCYNGKWFLLPGAD